MLPEVNKAVVPFMVSVAPFRSSVPLTSVILLTVIAAFKVQALPAATILTSSALPGMPPGDQFAAMFHEADTAPVQV